MTQQNERCLIKTLSIHVYVLEIGQRLVSRYRATTNLSITGERITFTMSPVSLEPVTVWLVTGERFVY